jgi:uncharacterized membrane protein YdjX (TVP38/TMEM64 family)
MRSRDDEPVVLEELAAPVETPPAAGPSLRWVIVAGALVTVLIVVASGPGGRAVWDAVKANLDDWRGQTQGHLLTALLVYFAIYAVGSALPLPLLTCMTLLAGALFGRWLGTLAASLAYTAGVTVSFVLARWLLRERVRRRFGPRIDWLNRRVERDGAFYLLTLRLLPSVPFYVVNLLMGLSPMRLGTYVIVSWIGVLPITFLYAGVGTSLAELQSPADVLSVKVLGSLAALAVFPWLVRKALRWRAARRTRPPTPGGGRAILS